MSFKVGIYTNHSQHQQHWCGAFAEGLKRHGVDYSFEDTRIGHSPADLVVAWSHRHSNLYDPQRAQGLPYLVLERGFIGDRERFTSTGFNGLCGRADWFTKNDLSRFNANHKDLMKPWRKRGQGQYILVIGQCRGDMALNGMDFEAWLTAIQPDLARFDLPVYFRPHPLDGAVSSPFERLEGTLEDALDGAEFVVTYSSTVGVESVLSGVPTVTIDNGSMAYDVTSHNLLYYPPKPYRLEWAARLAWCQWTEEEFRSGEVWEHLKGYFD